MRRSLAAASAVVLLVLIGVAALIPGPTELAEPAPEAALFLFRGLRIVALAVVFLFAVPLLVAIEPSLERLETGRVALHEELVRWLIVLGVVIAGAAGLELVVFGPQPPLLAPGFCTPIFWLLVILGIIIIIVVANRERIGIKFSSSTGSDPIMQQATGSVVNIDISVAGFTNKGNHRPVNVTIDKVVVKAAPGATGNVDTDVTARLSLGGQGTPAATATAQNVGGFPQPLTPGVSEMEITATATCAKGHTATTSKSVPFTR